MAPRKFRRDSAHPPGGKGPRKVKRTISLTAETSRRLDAHAVGYGLDCSELVERLITEHCRRFILQDRGDTGAGPAVPEPAGQGGQADTR